MSAGALCSIAFFSSVCSQAAVSPCGITRMSTLPLSNSATAVLGSGMMRAISVSVAGAPPQYVGLRVNFR